MTAKPSLYKRLAAFAFCTTCCGFAKFRKKILASLDSFSELSKAAARWLKFATLYDTLKMIPNMKNLLFTLLLLSLFTAIAYGQNNSNATPPKKMKLLVHITQGPENPTRAALGFLIAKIFKILK